MSSVASDRRAAAGTAFRHEALLYAGGGAGVLRLWHDDAALALARGRPRGTAAGAGWRQLALVTRDHAAANRGQPHDDHPANNSRCHY